VAARGATFEGVTLATTRIDLIRALLESIACELSLTIARLRKRGIESALVRAGGTVGVLIDWKRVA
jgi:sugar (pentulose or hexulose) kinase